MSRSHHDAGLVVSGSGDRIACNDGSAQCGLARHFDWCDDDCDIRPVTLTLAEAMLGHGLAAAELSQLSAPLDELSFQRGETLFRRGDPGDALYVSVLGDIGLRLQVSGRRLASFAPGVTIGEMAVLAHVTRSAEAYAETDVRALRLSVEAFDRLMAEQPRLAAKLLRSVSLHLADRVRQLTADLGHWVARAVGRQAGDGPVFSDDEAAD